MGQVGIRTSIAGSENSLLVGAIRTTALECKIAILKHACPDSLLICPDSTRYKVKMNFFLAHFRTILTSPLHFISGFDTKPIFLEDSSL
jgi:hypothetical protein